MEDTCRGETCWIYQLMKDLGGKAPDVKDCPFYVELVWTPDPVGGKVETAKVIKDCSNKRSLLWLLEVVNPRLLGLQEANEQARNKVGELIFTLVKGFNQVSERAQIEKGKTEKALLSQ